MSRVMLFVQTGDGRPKCAKQFGNRVAWALQYFAKIRFGDSGQPTSGWLVECPDADAGRLTIEDWRQNGSQTHHLPCDYLHGRILASGGRTR